MRNIWKKRLIHSSDCVQELVTGMDRTVGRQVRAPSTYSSHLGPVVVWMLLGMALLLTEIMMSYVVVRITELEQTYGSLLSRRF
jgi:hypothetical protein